MNERPDLRKMTEAQAWAWADEQRAASRRAFEGQPPPPVSAAKRDDVPQWDFTGWAFSIDEGFPLVVDTGHELVWGTTVGLREVGDGGPLAEVVDLGALGRWALRRAGRGETWASSIDSDTCVVPSHWVPVLAWPVEAATAALPRPRNPRAWRARQTHLHDVSRGGPDADD